MTDFNKVLLAVAPHGGKAILSGFAASMPEAIARAELTTPLRLAHFLAQCAHESAGLSTTIELASGVQYEGRRDLGNVQKGDGRRFKGRGLLQITGRANYGRYGKAIGLDLVGEPELAEDFPAAAGTAAEYWRDRDINRYADKDDGRGVTREINGGENGLASRMLYLARAKHALADLKGSLLAAAAAETALKHAKLGAATAISPVALLAPSQMPASPGAVVALTVVGVISVGAVLYAARCHKQAATALTAAAKAA